MVVIKRNTNCRFHAELYKEQDYFEDFFCLVEQPIGPLYTGNLYTCTWTISGDPAEMPPFVNINTHLGQKKIIIGKCRPVTIIQNYYYYYYFHLIFNYSANHVYCRRPGPCRLLN